MEEDSRFEGSSSIETLSDYRSLLAQHEEAHDALRPFLRSRATQLAQEFAFLPTAPPHEEGGIFELRAYQLIPGTLLEWEATWCAFRARVSSLPS